MLSNSNKYREGVGIPAFTLLAHKRQNYRTTFERLKSLGNRAGARLK